MAENRRRQATIIGVALLGAGGLMLLHNSSPVAKPPAPPPPPPPPPAVIPPGTSSGGVPLPRPVVRAAPARVVVSKPAYYLVKNLNGSIRLRTTSRVQAIAAAVASRIAGETVWGPDGKLVYMLQGGIAKRTFYVAPKTAGPGGAGNFQP